MTRPRLVVIGNGMAGSRLLQELRRRDVGTHWHVTVIGDEPHAAYNRVLLSNVLAGVATATSIQLASSSTRADEAVDIITGVAVAAIDREARVVTTADGRDFPYDALVLATGSRAFVPPIDGLRRDNGELIHGAAVFRTLDDCDRILELARTAKRAIVLGGGLLGLEAARGLAGRGLDIELVHREPFLMERQLDVGAGAVLARTVRDLGVQVHVDAIATRVVGQDGFESLELDNGGVLSADLVVVACGVVPETALAQRCGLEVDRGVVVDDCMRTSDPVVYAIGECAQHKGQVYGLVAPAWEQATVLADVLTGTPDAARYNGSRLVTRLKAAGVELAAMGDVSVEVAGSIDGSGDEVLQFVDPARGTYKKVVIRDGRIAGAILLGDVATAATVMQLFDRGSVVPPDRLTLLFAGLGASEASQTPARIPDRATICRCNGVTKGAITACWLAGARTTEGVVERTRATTGCGTCRDTLDGIVRWLTASATEERSDCA